MVDNDSIVRQTAFDEVRRAHEEITALKQEHAAIVGELEAQRDAAIQRAEIAERKVREYEHAESQVEGE